MSKCQSAPSVRGKKPLTYGFALKSFIGYLEGTGKTAHTIRNYRLDLLSFERFLEKAKGDKPIALQALTPDFIDHFHSYLKNLGLKTNTRRRKLLTVRRFLAYLARRNKLPPELDRKAPAPGKMERIPVTVDSNLLVQRIQALPALNRIEARNRVLLWTLAESGCQVSEIIRLRGEDFGMGEDGKPRVQIRGKAARSIEISWDLVGAASELLLGSSGASQEKTEPEEFLFLGFNKFGPLGGPISPRGVELLVRAYGPRLEFPELTPRTFRHSRVLKWFHDGASREEIQRRLGLKTTYAFRAYEPILKARSSS